MLTDCTRSTAACARVRVRMCACIRARLRTALEVLGGLHDHECAVVEEHLGALHRHALERLAPPARTGQYEDLG